MSMRLDPLSIMLLIIIAAMVLLSIWGMSWLVTMGKCAGGALTSCWWV